MSDYRRLISYIYAYEGSVKGRNIGFAKLEARNNQCKIQVSVRKIFVGGQDMGVYLLTGTGEILLGKMFVRGGNGEFRTVVASDNVAGSGQGLDQCYGLTIHMIGDTWRSYTTIWEDAVAHAAAVDLEEATSEKAEEREMSRIPGSTVPEKTEEPVRFVKSEEPMISEDLWAPEKRCKPEMPAAGKTSGSEVPAASWKVAGPETAVPWKVAGPETAIPGKAAGPEMAIPGKVVESETAISGKVVESEMMAVPEKVVGPKTAIPGKAAGPETAIPEKVVKSEMMAVPEKVVEPEIALVPEKMAESEKVLVPEKMAESEKVSVPEKMAEPEIVTAPEKMTRPEMTAAPEKTCEPEPPIASEKAFKTGMQMTSEKKEGKKKAPETRRLTWFRAPWEPVESVGNGKKNDSMASEAAQRTDDMPEIQYAGGLPGVENAAAPPADQQMESAAPSASLAGQQATQQPQPASPSPAQPSPASSPQLGEQSDQLLQLEQEEHEEKEDGEKLWQYFQKHYPKIQAFDYNGSCEILLIKPQDIGLLPRETWNYGNNSFLLHGYYNHRYLILAKLVGEKGGVRFLLGVPGHYYSNEKYMASMFGFSNFVLSKMQPAGDGRFGYWYTDIRLGV